MTNTPFTRKLTILAQDPGVRIAGDLAFAQIDVSSEELAEGPTGYRVKVVDFDASANVAYAARAVYKSPVDGSLIDPFAPPPNVAKSKTARRAYEKRLLADPNFHAQNAYAIVMRTLARFEFALGRRVAWGFNGHQIHVAPHAFCDANAFYSEEDRGLLFGYFTGRSGETVHTCLSHDIVAHETAHALLDGLRDRLTDFSGPDQAAFHEGFADIVALLSIFSLEEIVATVLAHGKPAKLPRSDIRLVSAKDLEFDELSESVVLGLADQMGKELCDSRGDALRRSVELKPSRTYMGHPEFDEPHRRGEILVAAVMQTFLKLWVKRIDQLGTFPGNTRNVDMVVEEGAKVADHLLTIAIRALDYCPTVDITFGDYLAAMLTADSQMMPDDSRFDYRATLLKEFGSFGIDVPGDRCNQETGTWAPFDENTPISYRKARFESMLHDREEVFRFIWENREALKIDDRGYIEVISVRPCQRLNSDGFTLRETICEYVQIAKLFAAECNSVLGFKHFSDMRTTQPLEVYGGGVLIFDQYGRIKFHVAQRLNEVSRQKPRLEYLWNNGYIDRVADRRNRFALLHRRRALG